MKVYLAGRSTPWRDTLDTSDFEITGPHITDQHTGHTAAADLAAIREAQLVFVWLDSDGMYGSSAEIGYAVGLGVPVFLAIAWGFEHDEDYWYVQKLSDRVTYATSAEDAWQQFRDWASVRQPRCWLTLAPAVDYLADS